MAGATSNMPIDFDMRRWERLQRDYAAWWAGELDRPLIQIRVEGRDPGRPEPAVPGFGFAARYGEDVSPAEIVDRWDYERCCERYMGDAFPVAWPNFGAGAVAAFLGARVEEREETVWFHPAEEKEIADLHLRFDADSPWFKRVADIMRAAIERWQGLVQVGMTDLGGNLDILSTFRPGEQLLLDLYDHPEEVKRVTWEAHEAWWQSFEALDDILQPVNPGRTAWTSILSAGTYYILQCDFSYMVGPDMFDEFIKPELAASCRKLDNAFYHLDGPGQIPHLDSLLAIPELKGIQWVPGAGEAESQNWNELYGRIREAGKLVQVFGWGGAGIAMMDSLTEYLGSGKGIVYIGNAADEKEAVEFLDRYGVPQK